MITFKCQCGKVLKVRDNAAGKRVRCPNCQTVVQVPTPKPAGPPPDAKGAVVDKPQDEADFGLQGYEPEHGEQRVEGAFKFCPTCHMRLPETTVICTTCGYDFRIGKVYEPPKTLVQKIPWKQIVKIAAQLAALALVAVLAWMAYRQIASRKSEPPPKEEKGGSTVEKPRKRAVSTRRPPAIRVVAQVKPLSPMPPDALVLTAADGKTTAAKARALLIGKLTGEAADRLRVKGGYKVLKPGESAPSSASEVVEFRIEATVGWTYAKQGGKVVPVQPFIAWCGASIVRKNGAVIWPVKGESASYEGKRPGPEPSQAEAAAVASLKQATTKSNLGAATGKAAAAVIRDVLKVVPPRSTLAKRLEEGGGKPEARGGMPDHRRLLGPLKAKFARAAGSFEAELPVVRGAVKTAPYVALAFARTAASIDENPKVRQTYLGVCQQVDLRGKPPPRDQLQPLRELAEEHSKVLLGRAALWVLITHKDRIAWGAALRQLLDIAARRAPADAAATGSARLGPLELDILRELARQRSEDASNVALALLVRFRGEHREPLREFIKLPPEDEGIVEYFNRALASGKKIDLLHAVKRDMPMGRRGLPYVPRVIDAYHNATDPEVRATLLYGIASMLPYNAPAIQALVDMLGSSDVAQRRAGAKGLYLVGTPARSALDEMKAALASEKDPTTRSSLRGAIQRCQTRP